MANRGFLTEGEVMGAGARPEGSDLAGHDVDKLSSSSSDAAQLEDVEDEGTWVLSAQCCQRLQTSFHFIFCVLLICYFIFFSLPSREPRLRPGRQLSVLTLTSTGGSVAQCRVLFQVHFSCMSFLCLK